MGVSRQGAKHAKTFAPLREAFEDEPPAIPEDIVSTARHPRPKTKRALPALLAACLWLDGCTLVQSTLEMPGKAVLTLLPGLDEGGVDPVELQGQLLRFSDNYLSGVIAGSEHLQRHSQKLHPAELQTLRLDYSDNVLSIATGQNAFADLLDMVTLVSLTRMTVEDHWIPGEYGASAQPLLAACKMGETQIWKIADSVLSEDQSKDLRNAIAAWHKDNPMPEGFRAVRAMGFAKMIAKATEGKRGGVLPSVFNLLNIDPLAGLDPATRELAQTRLFAERALFLAQRMPALVRQQTELLAWQTAAMPETKELMSSAARLAEAADRFSKVAEQVPGAVSAEREKIVAALAEQRPGLVSLAAQTQAALTAGAQMAGATDGALKTFGTVMAQLNADPNPPDPQAEPFRIRDYAEAAERIERASWRLNSLFETFLQTTDPARFAALSARFDALSTQAQAQARQTVDYAFHKALVLIGVLCGSVLATALVYRLIATRLLAERKPRTT